MDNQEAGRRRAFDDAFPPMFAQTIRRGVPRYYFRQSPAESVSQNVPPLLENGSAAGPSLSELGYDEEMIDL